MNSNYFTLAMVHQLLLCASILQQNYIQTVSTLQALTGVLDPQETATYTLLTKPHNIFKPKFEPGKVNQIEQYYMRCTTTWNDSAAQELNLSKPIIPGKSDIRVERLFSGKEVKHWTLQVSDIPNAGKNPVLAQNFYESTLVHHHTARRVAEKKESKDIAQKKEGSQGGDAPQAKDNESDLMEIDPEDASKSTESKATTNNDAQPQDAVKEEEEQPIDIKDSFLQFLEELGYDVVNQYWSKGIRFFHGDIVIEIFKIFVRDDDPEASSADLGIKLKLLDESNTFQIKAFINYPKGTSVDLINQGTKSLVKIKELLHNLFELDVPDRMFMDARVNRNK